MITLNDTRSIVLIYYEKNDHYTGFGPGTVNIFRNMLGLPGTTAEYNLFISRLEFVAIALGIQ
jgi:hypothetical protein